MVRTGKSLLKALYGAIGVFVVLFVLFHIGGALYVSSIATKASTAFQSGIADDLAYLKKQGDAVAENELVAKYLLAKDSENLITELKKEKDARNIGLMGVADSEGVVIGRTRTSGRRGDNVFLTTPLGRVVANGTSVESVESTSGFDPIQIFLSTGRPIMHQGEMIGALFSNYLADDAYAVRFKKTYLSPGTEILFYRKGVGIYGDSFADPETRNLINSYFNSGSLWLQGENSGKTISLRDGTFYLVENIIFPGLEQSPGGALLFIPRKDISSVANLTTALVTLFVFIILALCYHVRFRREEKGWRYRVTLLLVSIPIFSAVIIALYAQNIGFLKLTHIPYPLYNSTLRLQPEFGIYDTDFEQRFSIVVDTGDENINAVEAGLVFDPSAVTIKALDTANSKCSYIIENSVDSLLGKAKIACVIIKSGGERGSLTIADVVVVPKHPGTFTLSFDKENTKVLANDGLGTDVLRTAQSGSYRVDAFDASLSTTGTTKTKTPARSFVVFSPTHPNESRWYNNDTARFVWKGKSGAVYKYEFNTSADTIPSSAHTVQNNSVEIPIPGDGIFYFHLQLAAGGPVAHYRIQRDRTPPSIVAINLSTDKVVAGDVVRVSFEGEDAGSGIQKNYYVDLGDHLFLPIGSELFVPFLSPGDQKIVLRVYDSAGNFSEKFKIIHVENPQ